ncbi:MAG: aminotransferase class III-fold pyridoxal phosphate-dependent enzyme, partial [Pseudomonadales bacterium]|nr:aminotransferase class III-fold pyridoxal phosphate-dependent enzyme [Pseudomonadales bacterium]
MSIFSELESSVQSYAKKYPVVFDRATGSSLFDESGREYIDFLAGAGSLNYGHNHPVLKSALRDYLDSDRITHGLDLHTRAKADFLTAFRNLILKPRGLNYRIQFTGPTGSNAVEAALKLARKVTGRSNVVCFTNGFHGVSLGSLAVTGNAFHRAAAGVPLQGAVRMPFDNYFGEATNTIVWLEKMLSDHSSGVELPAAIILETVQGEGGLNVASKQWIQDLQ